MQYVLPLLLICLTAGADLGNMSDLTREQPYEARRASSSNPDIRENADQRPIDPGGTLVLMDEAGPGIVTHFWNTIQSSDVFYPRSVVLRIYYNHSDVPSVEVPLGRWLVQSL